MNTLAVLMRFQGVEREDYLTRIPFALTHYIELADWTGRQVRTGNRSAMDTDLPPILKRLKIDEDIWFTASTEFEKSFHQWVGSETAIQIAAHNVGKTRSRSPPMPVY